MRAELKFTVEAQPNAVLLVDIPVKAEQAGSTTLSHDTFRLQHGSVHCSLISEFDQMLPQAIPQLNGVMTPIHDARLMGVTPTLETHGFQLFPAESLEPPQASNLTVRAIEEGAYYPKLEELIKDCLCADSATAFCTIRRTSGKVSDSPLSRATYAEFLHSDYSHLSWPAALQKILAARKWEQMGPPKVSIEAAGRANHGRRYAVLNAWHYLGPTLRSSHSHLVLCDPSTIGRADVIPLVMRCGNSIGGNYRLRFNQDQIFYYYSGATSAELICFVSFDSQLRQIFSSTPISTCLHSSFVDSTGSGGEPPRVSIDTRLLVVWD